MLSGLGRIYNVHVYIITSSRTRTRLYHGVHDFIDARIGRVFVGKFRNSGTACSRRTLSARGNDGALQEKKKKKTITKILIKIL